MTGVGGGVGCGLEADLPHWAGRSLISLAFADRPPTVIYSACGRGPSRCRGGKAFVCPLFMTAQCQRLHDGRLFYLPTPVDAKRIISFVPNLAVRHQHNFRRGLPISHLGRLHDDRRENRQ